jgi:hypothetical protein
MTHIGTVTLRRHGKRVLLTVRVRDMAAGLMSRPLFGIRSLHFGTKLRGQDILKGQGYGWDGTDHIRARQNGKAWSMTVPVRDNDPKVPARRFVRGNCYIRTIHNEIYYFDLRKWGADPRKAIVREGNGAILDIDFEKIPHT